MLSDRSEKEGNLDNLEAWSQALTVKECNGNDELQEARKGLINVLKDTCSDSKVNGNVQVKSIEEFDPPTKPHQNKYAFATASMTSILLDYDIGMMSEVVAHIKKDKRITNVQVEVLMGILNVFSLLELMMAERTSDWIGCLYTIMVVGAIFFVGPLIMGFVPNNALPLLGRFATHVGIGSHDHPCLHC